MITKTFKLTIATDTEEQMENEGEYLAMLYGAEEVDPEETKWIPCSERLPEKKGRYLCTVGAQYRNPREMYYAPQEWANKSDDATWRSVDGSYVHDWFVKAWMPLPDAYEESEDKK